MLKIIMIIFSVYFLAKVGSSYYCFKVGRINDKLRNLTE